MRRLTGLAAGLALTAILAVPAAAGLAVTALGHTGYLFSDGKTKILVDTLTEPAKDYPFEAPAADTLAKLERGEAPYDGVRLLLISHDHSDHYAPEPVVRFLAAHPKAMLVTTGEVVKKLAAVPGFDAVKARIAAPEIAWKHKLVRKFNGVTIEIDRLRHGDNGKWACQNDAFVFTLGGKRILFATASDGHFPDEYRDLGYAKRKFDLAFFNYNIAIQAAKADKPAALKPQGVAYLKELIGAKTTVLMHITPETAPSVDAMLPELDKALPGVTRFAKELESRTY